MNHPIAIGSISFNVKLSATSCRRFCKIDLASVWIRLLSNRVFPLSLSLPGHCIRCWECNSAYTPSCLDEFGASAIALVDCDQRQDRVRRKRTDSKSKSSNVDKKINLHRGKSINSNTKGTSETVAAAKTAKQQQNIDKTRLNASWNLEIFRGRKICPRLLLVIN